MREKVCPLPIFFITSTTNVCYKHENSLLMHLYKYTSIDVLVKCTILWNTWTLVRFPIYRHYGIRGKYTYEFITNDACKKIIFTTHAFYKNLFLKRMISIGLDFMTHDFRTLDTLTHNFDILRYHTQSNFREEIIETMVNSIFLCITYTVCTQCSNIK